MGILGLTSRIYRKYIWDCPIKSLNLSGIPLVSNSLDQDQARHFVEPDLGPNCLQRLSADGTSSFKELMKLETGSKIPSAKNRMEDIYMITFRPFSILFDQS